MIEKSPEAFRTISEVAEELDLPQHVLRFWETRFSQIKPLKRGGGRRYYRPEDINLLKGIRHLLYGEGYTIKGVQRILKEQGVRHVAGVWEIGSQEEVRETQAPREALAPEAAYAPSSSAATVPAEAPPVPAEPSSRPAERPGPVVRADPPAPTPASPPPALSPPASSPPVSQTPAQAAGPQGLSTEDIRQLKAALFELIECKRILDDARQRA